MYETNEIQNYSKKSMGRTCYRQRQQPFAPSPTSSYSPQPLTNTPFSSFFLMAAIPVNTFNQDDEIFKLCLQFAPLRLGSVAVDTF